jgi:hypothetical protein
MRIYIFVGLLLSFTHINRSLEISNDPRPAFRFHSILYFSSLPIIIILLIATVIWPKKLWITHFLILTYMAGRFLPLIDLVE